MAQPQESFIPLYSFSGKYEGMISVEEAKRQASSVDENRKPKLPTLTLSSNGKQGRRYRVTAAHQLPKATGWRPMDSGGYTVMQLEV